MTQKLVTLCAYSLIHTGHDTEVGDVMCKVTFIQDMTEKVVTLFAYSLIHTGHDTEVGDFVCRNSSGGSVPCTMDGTPRKSSLL